MEQISSPPTIDSPEVTVQTDAYTAYIELLKRTLTNLIYAETEIRPKKDSRPLRQFVRDTANHIFFNKKEKLEIIKTTPLDIDHRIDGRDWPHSAHTMVGLRRLDNVQFCVEQIIADDVPGDYIEAGVWRGGASILVRAIMALKGDTERTLYLADSFAGLPPPNAEKYPDDDGDEHYTKDDLAVSLEQVQANFKRYGLLNGKVKFLKGWFSETLPGIDTDKLSLIRADGDMYESTMDILDNLYPKLSVGGFIIIDDYKAIPACEKAVTDYRNSHGITEEMHQIDWTAAYWRRAR